jgi:hypothetical protein
MNNSFSSGYFDREIGDIRDTQRFREFKAELLAFIKREKSVTWRQINQEFPDHYWSSMAVEQLDGVKVRWHKERIPERIELL